MYRFKVSVVKVVDGDTVDVDIDLGFGMTYKKQRVRMLGIDTPESRTRDLVEKKFGKASKAHLKEILERPFDIELVSHDKGKFGRILGDIELEETRMIGREITESTSLVMKMIDNGYGVEYNGQSKELIQEAHLKNRDRLIKKGVVDG